MTGVAVLVVDRLGRRPLLLGGVSGMVSPFTSFRPFRGILLFVLKAGILICAKGIFDMYIKIVRLSLNLILGSARLP